MLKGGRRKNYTSIKVYKRLIETRLRQKLETQLHETQIWFSTGQSHAGPYIYDQTNNRKYRQRKKESI